MVCCGAETVYKTAEVNCNSHGFGHSQILLIFPFIVFILLMRVVTIMARFALDYGFFFTYFGWF